MKKASYYLAFILIIGLVFGPFQAFVETYLSNNQNASVGRLHTVTGNTVRVDGDDHVSVAKQIVRMRFPTAGSADLVVVTSGAVWSDSLAAASLCGITDIDVALLYSSGSVVDDAELIDELSPLGVERANRVQVLLIGEFVPQYVSLIENFGYNVAHVSTTNPIKSAEQIDQWHERLSGELSDAVLVVPLSKPVHASAAAGLAAGMGTPIVYTQDGKLPTESLNVVKRRNSRVTSYIVGIKALDKEESAKLVEHGTVRHLGHENPVINSIALARYYEPSQKFGFDYTRNSARFSKILSVCPIDKPLYSIAASQIGGPIVLVEEDEVPHRLLNHFWEIGPDFWVTPFEGPYVEAFIIGGARDISYGVQSRLDYVLEISPYKNKGDEGVSGLDAIAIGWIIANMCSAIWIFCHGYVRGKQISLTMKLGWTLLGLLLGPLAVVIYVKSYSGYSHQVADGEFPRPLRVQGYVATASSVSFGAAAMVLTTYLLFYRGALLLMVEGPFFFLGNPMVMTMLVSYAIGLALNAFVFMPTMARSNNHMTYLQAIGKSLLPVFISMTAAFVGMSLVMWWAHMTYLPMMPEESNVLWWGSAYLSTLAAFITAYPVNRLLVRLKLKEGNM